MKDFEVIEGGKTIEERAKTEAGYIQLTEELNEHSERMRLIYRGALDRATPFFQSMFGRDATFAEAAAFAKFVISVAQETDHVVENKTDLKGK